MEITLQNNAQIGGQDSQITLAGGIAWGCMAGFTGTLIMDLILAGGLTLAGLPASTCFSIVGDTLAKFLSMLGIQTAGGVPFGIATHYLAGPLIGAIFAILVARVKSMRVNTPKKGILLAVLYVEIVSQPILATTPILLKMTTAETLQWFGLSFVMHFIFAAVLGGIVSYGLLRKPR